MSVQAMSYVIDNSRQTGVAYTLMLMIANHADRYGRNAFPSIPTLAAECRTTERNIKRILPVLEASGELRTYRGEGPHGTHIFEVVLSHGGDVVSPGGGDKASPGGVTQRHPGGDNRCQMGVTTGVKGGDVVSPKPSLTVLNHQKKGGGCAPASEEPSLGLTLENDTWGEDDWLRKFLLSQKLVEIPMAHFLNHKWWERVSVTCNGLAPLILERTFAALGNHFVKNPSSRPVTKRGWLQKMENFLRKEREIMTREKARASSYGHQSRR